jgi:hypothetical protein
MHGLRTELHPAALRPRPPPPHHLTLFPCVQVGAALSEVYWRPGNSAAFLDLVQQLTGAPLTADAWVAELQVGGGWVWVQVWVWGAGGGGGGRGEVCRGCVDGCRVCGQLAVDRTSQQGLFQSM